LYNVQYIPGQIPTPINPLLPPLPSFYYNRAKATITTMAMLPYNPTSVGLLAPFALVLVGAEVCVCPASTPESLVCPAFTLESLVVVAAEDVKVERTVGLLVNFEDPKVGYANVVVRVLLARDALATDAALALDTLATLTEARETDATETEAACAEAAEADAAAEAAYSDAADAIEAADLEADTPEAEVAAA